MKSLLFLFLFFFALNTGGQIPFPKGFRLIKGEALSGKDDVCTNGSYTFQVSRIGWLEEEQDLVKEHGFHKTKDSLYWRTGKSGGTYFYEVYNGELIKLYSQYNDKGFSYYSKWLLSTMRKYHHSATLLFPTRDK